MLLFALFRIILKILCVCILLFGWWPEVESNHRHADFQSAALPTELSGHRDDSFYRIIKIKPKKNRANLVGRTLWVFVNLPQIKTLPSLLANTS